MAKVYSVGEFLDYINRTIGSDEVLIQGEITGAHPHTTGFYFSLKDQRGDAIMDCYMSPYAYRAMGIVLEDGMEIKALGSAGIYKPKGRFSFKVQAVELAGEGSIKKAYELMKKQLHSDGLFARKRPLPEFISRIGVITSRTGAVIDDFRKNLAKLGIRLFFKDVRVEGAQAVDQIVQAIKYFSGQAGFIDVLVLMRGGGSLEDLQAFNNEYVARAIFSSPVPTIVAIGHERDVPIAQMAADAAPSTPTAAAMLVNQSWDRLVRDLPAHIVGIMHGFEQILDDYRTQLDFKVPIHTLSGWLGVYDQKIAGLAAYLSSVNPEENLKLGYSIITDDNGRVIKNADMLKIGQEVSARLAKGKFISRVKHIKTS